MIFFFGVRSTTIFSAYVQYLTCIHCNNTDTIYIVVVSQYFHIFWIPIFPVGRKVYSVCNHCQQSFIDPQMPDDYKRALQPYKQQAKTPIWQFFGLIVIGVAIAVPLTLALGAVVISLFH